MKLTYYVRRAAAFAPPTWYICTEMGVYLVGTFASIADAERYAEDRGWVLRDWCSS